MHYDAMEPFGDVRANWHAAVISQILCAVNTPKEKRAPRVGDFMFRDAATRHEEDELATLEWLRKAKKHGQSS